MLRTGREDRNIMGRRTWLQAREWPGRADERPNDELELQASRGPRVPHMHCIGVPMSRPDSGILGNERVPHHSYRTFLSGR